MIAIRSPDFLLFLIAKVTFGSSVEFKYLDDLHKQKIKEIKWKKIQFPLFIMGGFLFIFLFIFIMGLIM